MFPNTVTGAPVVGSPSTSSPLGTLKHGSDLVKRKQEIIQKKEEEVETRNSPKKRVHIIPAQDYEYLNRNVFPTSIKPQDLGSNQDEELETGVSKSRYFGISIPIKYSNFSRFYKKMGPFYKKFRCDKFGN